MNVTKNHLAGHDYAYVAGSTETNQTLLLLHGTGGDELDLIPLGRQISTSAHLLSPRGNVSENGHPRFFRRLAEGIFDEVDVIVRSNELNEFIKAATTFHGLKETKLIAIGYSNGANIAAALMLLHSGQIDKAILLRSMLPLPANTPSNLQFTSILMINGLHDEMISADKSRTLAEVFERAGATVTHKWLPTGHRLTPADVSLAKQWIGTT